MSSAVPGSLEAVLYKSKSERIASGLVAVILATGVTLGAILWTPENVFWKIVILAVVTLGGVLPPLVQTVQPHASLGAGRLVVRNQWRRHVIPESNLVGIANKTRRIPGTTQDVSFPVVKTISGDVLLSGAGYRPQTPREQEVETFLGKLKAAMPSR